MQIYTVRTNDTIDTIGTRFGVNPLELAWINQIEYPYRLAVGQALLILSQEELAESQGEMMSEHGELILGRGAPTENGTPSENGETSGNGTPSENGEPSGNGTPPENGAPSDGGIPSGKNGAPAENETPVRKDSTAAGNGDMPAGCNQAPGGTERRRSAWFNGYAYPWINQDILEETCNFLSAISIFSYGFTEEGDLVPPQAIGEQRVLEEAGRQDVVPVLVLTPLDAGGHFNNNLVTVLVRNLEVQQRVIRGIWEEAQEKGYGIVDVDFEYVLAEDRELLVDFVRRLRTIMNLYGVKVSVALAPKTSRGQKGLLYEGLDYGALGEAADGVLLMTYEWGYTYEPTS